MGSVASTLAQRTPVIGIYLMMALLATFPMVLSPIDTVVGHEEASVGCHVWVYWWAQNYGTDFVTPMIFYPYGADVVQLYGSDLLSPLLASVIPLPPALIYNIWVVFLLILGAMGIRRLVLSLSGTVGGAFVGGTVFLTGAFFHHEILNGTSEILAVSTVVWFLVHLRRLLDAPAVTTGLTLGLWAGVATALSAYNPFFLMVVTLCELLHRATQSSKPIFTRDLWVSGSVSLLGLSFFLVPVAWLHLRHGAGDTFSRREDWLNEAQALPDSFASLFDWVNPTEAQIPVEMIMPQGGIFEYWTTCSVFLGFTALGLLGWGLLKRRWEPRLRPFLWMFFVGVVIAMGPYLRIDGTVFKIGGWSLPLPAQTIAYLFPPFIITAIHAYRYTTVVMIGLSVMVGSMARHWLWGVALIIELIVLSPVPWPAPVTSVPTGDVIAYLSEAKDGAVFTAPVARENLHDLGVVLMLQTKHGKAVHEGGIHRRAGSDSTRLFQDNPMVDALSGRFGPSFVGDKETLWSIRDIVDKGFQYVLVPSSEAETILYFSNILGNATKVDENWTLWELK